MQQLLQTRFELTVAPAAYCVVLQSVSAGDLFAVEGGRTRGVIPRLGGAASAFALFAEDQRSFCRLPPLQTSFRDTTEVASDRGGILTHTPCSCCCFRVVLLCAELQQLEAATTFLLAAFRCFANYNLNCLMTQRRRS